MSTLKVPITAEDHIQGSIDLPIVLVEYGDFECPHCGHAYPIVKQVQSHFGDKLGFIFRNFPLTQIHRNAESAAESAEFAGAHKRFWEMHDGLFENQSDLGPELLINLVQTLRLSGEDLERALEGGEFTSRVKQDLLGGVRSGVNGTPTFFINGKRHDGPFERYDLIQAIESTLS
jgi:protein-disulfide isomerase